MAKAFPGKGRVRKHRLAITAALGFALGLSAAYAVSIQPAANSRLQEVADNAALAGVNSLAATPGQPAPARSFAAIAAASKVIEAKSGIVRALSPSVDGLTMSVVVEDAEKGTRASATARYIPPKDGRPARQAANVTPGLAPAPIMDAGPG